jgi:PD-(D/E)XK endonuclease
MLRGCAIFHRVGHSSAPLNGVDKNRKACYTLFCKDKKMKLIEHTNSKNQGLAGIGSAIKYFTDNEITVSIPLNDSQGYDLVADIKGVLSKVQVKTTSCKQNSGHYKASLRTTGGNQSFSYAKDFDKKSCDYLFILAEDGSEYFIPTKVVENINSITLCEKYNEYRVS